VRNSAAPSEKVSNIRPSDGYPLVLMIRLRIVGQLRFGL
jgi:hypothetical protein